MTDNSIRCDRLEELLPDYLEGTLGAVDRGVVETHLASCERCASLVADVKTIAVAARELPELEPEGDLWSGISARIAAPVITLPTERERKTTRIHRWRLVAAAAALVVSTAGITYFVTAQLMRTGVPREIASGNTPSAIVGGQEFVDDTTAGRPRERASEPELPSVSPATGPRRSTTPDRTRLPVASGAPSATNVARSQAERVYSREIDQLQALLDARRSELDPATVDVVERNLLVIDEAIRQSRQALSRDPSSRFLNEQLNSALDKKVELLRTVAMLPSST